MGDSNAPKMERATNSAPTTSILSPRESSRQASSTASPERLSKATMMDFRLARSARMPPKGERRMVGAMASARIVAKTVADPVSSRTNMERANFRVLFPSRELACPTSNRVKFRVKSFSFMASS